MARNIRGMEHINEHAEFIASQPSEAEAKKGENVVLAETYAGKLTPDPQYILQVRDLKTSSFSPSPAVNTRASAPLSSASFCKEPRYSSSGPSSSKLTPFNNA